MRKILFMQGDQSDLHTVAALVKSDVPGLPAQLPNSRMHYPKEIQILAVYHFVEYNVSINDSAISSIKLESGIF